MTKHVPEHSIGRLLFVSRATFPLGHVSDLDIMRCATQHNKAQGIAGVMLRSEDSFCQVLEGPQDALETVWQRIRVDSRHGDIHHWWQRCVQSRLFPHWKTETWSVSPQTQETFLGIVRAPAVSMNDKVIVIRAFAQMRGHSTRASKSRVKYGSNVSFDRVHGA